MKDVSNRETVQKTLRFGAKKHTCGKSAKKCEYSGFHAKKLTDELCEKNARMKTPTHLDSFSDIYLK